MSPKRWEVSDQSLWLSKPASLGTENVDVSMQRDSQDIALDVLQVNRRRHGSRVDVVSCFRYSTDAVIAAQVQDTLSLTKTAK